MSAGVGRSRHSEGAGQQEVPPLVTQPPVLGMLFWLVRQGLLLRTVIIVSLI